MALSPHTTRLFVRLVASALAAAAIAAPTALSAGSPDAFERAVNRHLATDTASPSGLISENSASQNRVAAAQRDYGPPDPWLYPYMHNGALIGRNSERQAIGRLAPGTYWFRYLQLAHYARLRVQT